jgi:hypothetical protein
MWPKGFGRLSARQQGRTDSRRDAQRLQRLSDHLPSSPWLVVVRRGTFRRNAILRQKSSLTQSRLLGYSPISRNHP